MWNLANDTGTEDLTILQRCCPGGYFTPTQLLSLLSCTVSRIEIPDYKISIADILAAYLGGKLVYEYGMGVQRQGAGLDFKKQQQMEKEKQK